jgi:LPS sulfotransferase NodH
MVGSLRCSLSSCGECVMQFSVGHFFETTEEIGVLEFLLKRQSGAAVVCDQGFYNYLRPHSDNKPYSLLLFDEARSSPVIADPSRIANVFICVSGNQPEIKQNLSATFPKSRMFSLWSDVVPALSAGCSPLGIPAPVSVHTKFAIICAARSGSEYLCSVLSGLKGLGAPREHLREFTIDLIRTKPSTGFNVQDWFQMIVRCGTRDGVFSTKIIGEFVGELELSTPHNRTIVRQLLSNFKFVRIYRDKVEQAVSAYIASAARQWHVRDQTHLDDYNRRKETIPYDFGSIKWLFDKSKKAEEDIDTILDTVHAEALAIEYPNIIGDIGKVVYDIQKHVGLSDSLEQISGGGVVRTFDSKNAEFCRRFSAELNS